MPDGSLEHGRVQARDAASSGACVVTVRQGTLRAKDARGSRLPWERRPMNTSIGASAFESHEVPTLQRWRQSRAAESPLVLVVEDDLDTRLIYSECLRLLGYRTATAPSGELGIRTALSTRPRAIVMDVAMQGIGGIEATRRIKADARTRACLVVVVSAHGTTVFPEARRAGCDAYFCKPFNAFTLDSVLHVLTTARANPRRPEPTAIVKRCGCGRDYTQDAWLALPLRGRMHTPGGGLVVDLRNCPCGSSIALPA
jgi:two-component system cell cycle response regulator DivK